MAIFDRVFDILDEHASFASPPTLRFGTSVIGMVVMQVFSSMSVSLVTFSVYKFGFITTIKIED
jgi:hypothetical protein